MNRVVKYIIAIVVVSGIGAGLTLAFIEGRAEIAREREKEAPIKVPPRVTRSAEGESIVTVDRETQERIGLQVSSLAARSAAPEIVAYGRILEDAGASFVVRAPVAGILIADSRRAWPTLGETITDGVRIGAVEPFLGTADRFTLAAAAVDLTTRLSDARGEVDAADARLKTARAALDRAKSLNADNKNVSDRVVQEAEATVSTEEARIAAARRNVSSLEAASNQTSAALPAAPLTVVRGGEVVELLAQPNENVEAGQALLRVTRFDSALARVDAPVGAVIDRSMKSARIEIVGYENQIFNGERVSVAASVDPTTFGEGFVFRLTGTSGASGELRRGTAIVAYLPSSGPVRAAVFVPDTAILRSAGKIWVYRQIEDDKFSRVAISLDRAAAGGSLVLENLKPGDRIVVRGGQLLLSEEQKSNIRILEEAESK